MNREDLYICVQSDSKLRNFADVYLMGVLDSIFGNMEPGEEEIATKMLKHSFGFIVDNLSSLCPDRTDDIKRIFDEAFFEEAKARFQAGILSTMQ